MGAYKILAHFFELVYTLLIFTDLGKLIKFRYFHLSPENCLLISIYFENGKQFVLLHFEYYHKDSFKSLLVNKIRVQKETYNEVLFNFSETFSVK